MCLFWIDTIFLYNQPLFTCIIMKKNFFLSSLHIRFKSVRVLYIICVRWVLNIEVQHIQNWKFVLSWETIVHQPCAPRGRKFVLRNQCWHWARILSQIIILWLLLFCKLLVSSVLFKVSVTVFRFQFLFWFSELISAYWFNLNDIAVSV